MKSPLLLLFFFFATLQLSAQKVVQYAAGFEFREGVYLSFDQFKNNSPVPKKNIVSKFNRDDSEFLPNILEAKTFSYKDENDSVHKINVADVWGYSSNGNVFIKVEDDFNRIAVLGSISHFLAAITVYNNMMNGPFFDPYFGPSPLPYATQEMNEMILDFQTGRTTDFTQENLESILQRDHRLYDEFIALKKSQKRDLMFLYLRKYNEKHPIFFPVE